uniref:Histidine acid phosphatase n=1 Tax=Ascaris lumbricoides TaxID=6252 RepID=A0A9J2Q3T6_ASCLU
MNESSLHTESIEAQSVITIRAMQYERASEVDFFGGIDVIMRSYRLLLLNFLQIISISLQYSPTLQSVQILFRHGQRAPTKFIIFPKEDPKLLDNFSVEAGELTNDGIMQEYQLGHNIRSTYNTLIGQRYVPSKLLVLTGVDNRTVVSALSVLASLFPPEGDQVWTKVLQWQPIAVHTQPILDHFSFGALNCCPILSENIKKSKAYKEIAAQDPELKDWLTNMTGINARDLTLYNNILDTLIIRACLKQLPPPIWAHNSTMEEIFSTKQHLLHSQIIDTFLSQSGGWLMNLFVEGIENRIMNRTNHRLLLYSAVIVIPFLDVSILLKDYSENFLYFHDTTIQTFGKFLAIAELDTLIPFGAYLALEHHLKDQQHIAELWYHPTLNGSRIRIMIPGCPDPCHFETLKKLKQRVSSSSWMSICYGQESFCDDYTVVLGAMIGLTILLGILSVLLIFVCCAYRHRLKKLLDPEQQSLLLS